MRDSGAEPAVELRRGGCCLFEDVEQQSGGDDFIRLAVVAEQTSDLEWMDDERGVVDFSVLTSVASSGEPQRGPCRRQPGERACGAPWAGRGRGRAKALIGGNAIGEGCGHAYTRHSLGLGAPADAGVSESGRNYFPCV